MKLFNKKNGHKEPHQTQAVDLTKYSKSELEKKADTKEMMTYDEIQALSAYRHKDIINEVLRIIGLCGFLFFTILAIGTFLYPYSFFNFIPSSPGKQDTFWCLWNNISFYIGEGSYANANNGWETIETIYTHAFYDSVAKENFIALGAWSIIPVATVGLVTFIWLAAYIAAFSIKDLINMIHRLRIGTAQAFESVVATGKQSIDETIPVKEQKKELTKQEEAKIKDDLSNPIDSEEEIDNRVEKMKKELAEEEKHKTDPIQSSVTPIKEAPVQAKDKVEAKTEVKPTAAKLDQLDDDELDKLLKSH